jgi:hypothetical protein
MQTSQLLFRKLSQARSYVNENSSVGTKNLASTCLLIRNLSSVRFETDDNELIITFCKIKLVKLRILEFQTLIKRHKYP